MGYGFTLTLLLLYSTITLIRGLSEVEFEWTHFEILRKGTKIIYIRREQQTMQAQNYDCANADELFSKKFAYFKKK